MIETQKDIDSLLEIMGEVLTFSFGTIFGIPGFETTTFAKGEISLYEVERQTFSFHTSTKNVVTKSIVIDMTFTMKDTNYTYTFKIDHPPIQDLIGFSELKVNLISKVVT